ncbi:PAS domain-containing protein [Parasphingopyxis sp. CP4]|uniref:sensor histidine kinase n=1 Tax=Parasphingopyxis sp. CP4 TaxID=2724527 RepID=UPI0015A22F04|nr:PAS domain-containing sensor histidine kinase [Parasphingopyxis sp. CP4]QLC21573.1 PAS domain-containing protein [Parasphingopyxis sp. CP4]
MITISTTAAVVTGMLLAAWLGVAVWATVLGLRRKAAGERAAAAARRGGLLLENTPAVFMLVDAKGRINAGPGLEEWLGLSSPPKRLIEFKDLLGEDRFDSFSDTVITACRTAKSFGMELRVTGSDRILFSQGGPAPDELGGNQASMIWIFDATETRSEILALSSRADQAHEALNALSALIEAAPFPMWHRAPDLRLTLVNKAYVRAVEAENSAEAISRGLELIDMPGKDSARAVAARVREDGEPHSRTVPATIRGERRMMQIVDVPLGEVGVAGYSIDVDQLEGARAELARFARAQRDMLDLLSAGVAQFDLDRTLIFSNQPFQRIFEMKNEWLTDRPEFDRVLDRMREADRVPEVRDFPEWKAERRDWFLAADGPAEENWLLADGTHLRVVAQPLPDGGLLLIFEDRTEQAQLASARDTLLQVRTATFDNLSEAIGVFAADGRLHIWNRRFREVWDLDEDILSNHPRVDELTDTIAERFRSAGSADAIQTAVRSATAERQQASGRLSLHDGRYFDFAAVPLPDGNALFTLLDISDSKRIEAALLERNEALEAGDRLKTAFVSNISYELRTPLTSIAGFAEMLDGGYAGDLPEQAAEYVKSILDSVATLRVQIDEVLDLTQGEAEDLPMAKEEVDLQLLCEEAAADARVRAAARHHEFVAEIDWSVGSVIGDARRLRQSLDHLLRNAIRYTPEGGRVLLHAEGSTGEARITVSDNGVGITEEDRARVFDRFHRGSGEQQSRALGLGLPLTKQFVEAHAGTLELNSEPGEGTFVTIALPREGQQ